MLKNIVLYDHSGSGNHGCEALARTTASLLSSLADNPIKLISWKPEEDRKYLSDMVLEIIPRVKPLSSLQHGMAKILKSVTGSLYLYDRSDRNAIFNTHDSLCISIGGDNYCYKDYDVYCRENRYLNQRGNKTVLWGCSIEPELLKQKNVLDSMKQYALITARESITYDAMKKAGLENVMYCPDTAFLLPTQPVVLPPIFNQDVVGINVSPMVLEYESTSGMTMKNYENLIRYILQETSMNIALIPHVIVEWGDDLKALRKLKECFGNEPRIQLIDEEKKMNCCQLKYVISHCKAMVAARTHASIAAYSTNVPTLVTGYSVKAKGIAKDIFGTDDGYVCPVQGLMKEDMLSSAFISLLTMGDCTGDALQEVKLNAENKFAAVLQCLQGFIIE